MRPLPGNPIPRNQNPPKRPAPRWKPRRRLSLALALPLAFLAVCLPVAGLLWVSYRQTVSHIDDQLLFLSRATEARTDGIFTSTRNDLQDLAFRTRGLSDAQTVPLLQKSVFDSLYVSEFGRITDGSLACNNQKVFQPPVPIRDPAHLAVSPTPGGLAIVPPAETLQGGPRLICNYRADPHHILNALINPAILTEFHDYTKIGDQSGVFLVFDDGRRVLSTGRMAAAALPPINARTPALTHYGGSRLALTRSGHYPFVVVAAASDPYLLREWRRNAAAFGLLGLLVSCALMALIARAVRAALGPEAALENALRLGQFVIHYQPMIRLTDGRCVGAEALLRWQHPVRGLIPPAAFIPLAEQTGLLLPMTLWLLGRTAEELGPLLRRRPDLHVAFNIGVAHLRGGELAGDADRLLKGRIAARQVVFEITESRPLGEGVDGASGDARPAMRSLRERGYRLALDDFGTGYSNLNALEGFPLDILKVDKAFVDGIGEAGQGAGLVDCILDVAAALGLETVAEGIEREAQAAYLSGRGVPTAQGWLYARPMPAAEFAAFCDSSPEA